MFHVVDAALALAVSHLGTAGAIAACTAVLALFTAPLTVRGLRAGAIVRALQPQAAKLSKDPAALQALYREHGVTPLSPLLPALVQGGMAIVLLRSIRHLAHVAGGDLALTGFGALGAGAMGALAVYAVLAAVVCGASILSQRVDGPATGPAWLRWSGLAFAASGLFLPLAVTLSIATSSAARLAITVLATRHGGPPAA